MKANLKKEQNIRIDTGEVRLTINGDPDRVIAFNPQDLNFAQGFFDLLEDFKVKSEEYEKRLQGIKKDNALNEYGIPCSTKAMIGLTKEICEYIKTQIDILFGEGTSKTAFGNANVVHMFEQFFDGVSQYIQTARQAKLEKYLNK